MPRRLVLKARSTEDVKFQKFTLQENIPLWEQKLPVPDPSQDLDELVLTAEDIQRNWTKRPGSGLAGFFIKINGEYRWGIVSRVVFDPAEDPTSMKVNILTQLPPDLRYQPVPSTTGSGHQEETLTISGKMPMGVLPLWEASPAVGGDAPGVRLAVTADMEEGRIRTDSILIPAHKHHKAFDVQVPRRVVIQVEGAVDVGFQKFAPKEGVPLWRQMLQAPEQGYDLKELAWTVEELQNHWRTNNGLFPQDMPLSLFFVKINGQYGRGGLSGISFDSNTDPSSMQVFIWIKMQPDGTRNLETGEERL